MITPRRILASLILCAALLPAMAWANVREIQVPLHDGKVSLTDLAGAFGEHSLLARLLPGPKLEFDVRGNGAYQFEAALQSAFKGGCNVTCARDALWFAVDPARVPPDCDTGKRVLRVFAELAAPEATAKLRAHWGLHLQQPIDPDKPLVILIHGLDCGPNIFGQLLKLLHDAGYQTATFGYPCDGPIADSAAMLADDLADLHKQFPHLKTDLIGHSLGALVARAYVEGNAYHGDVDHLIQLCPPNHGSDWTKYSIALKMRQNYMDWKYDKDYSATWIITEGLEEAVDDMAPESYFLTHLNSGARRAGVKYTIVAGNQHPAWRLSANLVEAPADWVPRGMQNVWGIRQARAGLEHLSDTMRHHAGDDDGPVTVQSAKLDGVSDFVVVPADHITMYYNPDGQDPGAWETIKARLAN